MSANNIDALAALRTFTGGPSSVTEQSILEFLQRQPEFGGEKVSVRISPESLAAGASGGTVLFNIETTSSDARFKDGFVLRYDLGADSFFTQTSLSSQFQILRALKETSVPVPEALWLDEAGNIAGAPALIMRRVQARAPTIQYLQAGRFTEVGSAGRADMVRRIMKVVLALHRVDVTTLDLSTLEQRGGAGEHFIDRQIAWTLGELRPKFPADEEGERVELHREIRTFLEDLAIWLRENAPRQRTATLVHGDATIANTMFREDGSVAALLDWELTHLGLPEFDIAYFYCAMRSIGCLGTSIEDLPTLDDIASYYVDAGGELKDWEYGRVLAAWCVTTWGAIGLRRMPREFWPAQRLTWVTQRDLVLDAKAAFDARSLTPKRVET